VNYTLPLNQVQNFKLDKEAERLEAWIKKRNYLHFFFEKKPISKESI